MKRKNISSDLNQIFSLNSHEILNYKLVIEGLGLNSEDYIIAVINIEDEIGKVLVELLFEKNSDEQFYDSEFFFVRGLAERACIQKKLNIMDRAAADRLLDVTGTPVIVADKGIVEIFHLI